VQDERDGANLNLQRTGERSEHDQSLRWLKIRPIPRCNYQGLSWVTAYVMAEMVTSKPGRDRQCATSPWRCAPWWNRSLRAAIEPGLSTGRMTIVSNPGCRVDAGHAAE